jgi:ElaB/YqjD/DUF883 family membrane-anchored ribosome-binding protein
LYFKPFILGTLLRAIGLKDILILWRSAMAEELKGMVRSVGTKVEESVSGMADNTKAAAEGLMNQTAEAAQDAYGKTVDAAKDGVETVKDAAVAGHDFLGKFMEDNPHTTTAIALGIGVLIGYTATRQPARRG